MENAAYILVVSDHDVKYYLRDIDSTLVAAWEEEFKEHKERIKVSKGDIFTGAPEVDAIVSPSNSFGFMDGPVDGACRKKFGDQIQNRLQNIIKTKYDGEILLGQAIIIPTSEEESKEEKKGDTIKYLIYTPTMRIPTDISATANVYLCFRAILLAVHRHNRTPGNKPIKSVLVPGLGTGVGKMPKARCAHQMLQAYETFVVEAHPSRISPENLEASSQDHIKMCKYDGKKEKESDKKQ